MNSMFYNCSSLTSLDVTHFDTTSATSMNAMFMICNNLVSLDLSSFDTTLVTNMSNMFANCTQLVTIKVSPSFIVDQVTSSSNMFNASMSLVGGNGTIYNTSNPKDKTYAHIDVAGNPGYFTAA